MTQLKIAVINFSGNVGKSTIARHLILPRLEAAQLIAVESINADDSGPEAEAVRGKQFGELIKALALMDAAVVDIGASNVEDFINRMAQYDGSHEEFDLFVVPTVSTSKQQRDTISTIEALSELGVPAKKIRLVFNQVEVEDNPNNLFAPLISYNSAEKKATLKTDAVIHSNEIFGLLKGSDQSIIEIMHDTTDFKALIKEASDPAEKLMYAQKLGIKRLASGVTKELDAVFKALIK